MGLKVVALDIAADKLALAAKCGAEMAVDARSPEAVAERDRSPAAAHMAFW